MDQRRQEMKRRLVIDSDPLLVEQYLNFLDRIYAGSPVSVSCFKAGNQCIDEDYIYWMVCRHDTLQTPRKKIVPALQILNSPLQNKSAHPAWLAPYLYALYEKEERKHIRLLSVGALAKLAPSEGITGFLRKLLYACVKTYGAEEMTQSEWAAECDFSMKITKMAVATIFETNNDELLSFMKSIIATRKAPEAVVTACIRGFYDVKHKLPEADKKFFIDCFLSEHSGSKWEILSILSETATDDELRAIQKSGIGYQASSHINTIIMQRARSLCCFLYYEDQYLEVRVDGPPKTVVQVVSENLESLGLKADAKLRICVSGASGGFTVIDSLAEVQRGERYWIF